MTERSRPERRDDCGRVAGGKFGPKNQCQDDGNGGGTSSPGRGFKGTGWKSDDKALVFNNGGKDKLSSVGPAARDMSSVVFSSPKTTLDVATAMGLDSVEELVKIGAAGFKDADMQVDVSQWSPGGKDKSAIDIFTAIPIEDFGQADLRVSLSMFHGEEPEAEFGNFEIDDATRVAIEKTGGDDSPLKRRLGGHIFDKALESLATLEAKGINKVSTHAYGNKDHGEYQGYRLWGRFGFDGPLDGDTKAKLAMTDGIISKEQRTKIRQGKELNLQELLSTPAGEDWWRENGRSIKLKLDFSNKESAGYKQYSRMKTLADRARKRKGERGYMKFMRLASRSYVCYDLEKRAYCPTGEGGGVKNDCAPDEAAFKGPPDIVGERGKSTKETFPPAWSGSSDIDYEGSLPGVPGIEKITARNPSGIRKVAEAAGIESVSQLLQVFAATSEGSRVELDVSSAMGVTTVRADTTINMKDVGEAEVATKIELGPGPGESRIYYGFFQVEEEIKEQIAEGNKAIESKVTAEMYDKMIESMSAAEKTNIKIAKTNAAGSPSSTRFKGYKIWGRFGFDGRIHTEQEDKLKEFVDENPDSVTPQLREKLQKKVRVTLQEVIETPAGERWWRDNGSDIDLTFDFTNKDSLGYKRFSELRTTHARVKARKSQRSLVAFVDFLQRTSLAPISWPGFTEIERRNCGIGPGGFQKGNTCATGAAIEAAQGATKGAYLGAVFGAVETVGFPPAIAASAAIGATIGAVKGLYNNQMQPTKVNRAMKNLGLDDDKVVSIVKGLKGSPASVAKSSSKKSVDLEIKNKDGKKTFDVKIEKDKVTVTPAVKGGKISAKQANQIAEIAKTSGRAVDVVVNDSPPSAMAKLAKAGGSLALSTAGAMVISFSLPAYSLAIAPFEVVGGELAGEFVRKSLGV